MNAILGIISYLPDDKKIREHRLNKLLKLLDSCNTIFNLPIYILIQNYHDDEIETLEHTKNVSVSPNFNKLGILNARKLLRRTFLSMNLEYLIMLDDDCDLKGTRQDGEEYIKQLEEHPGCFGEFKLTLLKLFSISRDLLEKEDFPNINPENEEGFEDRVFVNKLRIKYPNKRFTYSTKIIEYSVSTKDSDSTWYINQDLSKMLQNTQEEIAKFSD